MGSLGLVADPLKAGFPLVHGAVGRDDPDVRETERLVGAVRAPPDANKSPVEGPVVASKNPCVNKLVGVLAGVSNRRRSINGLEEVGAVFCYLKFIPIGVLDNMDGAGGYDRDLVEAIRVGAGPVHFERKGFVLPGECVSKSTVPRVSPVDRASQYGQCQGNDEHAKKA